MRDESAMLVRLLATMVLAAPLQLVLAAKHEEVCRFPHKWQGAWFQSGFRQPITIDGARLSTKGRCLSAEGDKFVVLDEKGCYRCVVIHEKHANVLQYKETYCHSKENLANLCSLITGDALLFSMFRIEAQAVSCPFKGPFTFTYNRGHGDCRSPVSSIDSCTEESRLLLSYQACPDVHGTESTVEELQCLATWKEGSSRYLVGKVTHNHATSSEDRYRCFVYEKATLNGADKQLDDVTRDEDVDYRVAQSGDATCNGLSSPMEGSRTMTLKRASSPNSKCRFPSWLTSSSHWHTLDYTRSYSFHHHNTTLRIANSSGSAQPGSDEMRVSCTEVVKQQARMDAVYIVTHFTMGCQSGFLCMVFYKRDGHVIEVQTGAQVRRAEDACQVTHFNRTAQPFVTLVTSSPEPRQCPYLGKFSVTGVTRDQPNMFRARRSLTAVLEHHHDNSLHVSTTVSSVVMPVERPPPDSHERFYNDLLVSLPNPRTRRGQEAVSDDLLVTPPHPRKRRGQEAVSDDLLVTPPHPRTRRGQEAMSDPCGDDLTTLVVGCSTMDTMEFRSECAAADVISASYSCHGRWEDNGTHYLITTPLSRTSHGARRYCFMYREVEGVVHFSSSSDSCLRDTSGVLTFNITSSGQCVEASHAAVRSNCTALLAAFVLLVYLLSSR